MPYIDADRREDFSINDDFVPVPETPGELNYVLTTAVKNYIELRNFEQGRISYADYNEIIGVLECMKQEIYRRLIVPYEEKKIAENGDVF